MIRILIYALTILHLGPGAAFALLAFGCDSAGGALGELCGKGALAPFVLLTLGAWTLLLAGWAALHAVQQARRAPQPSPRQRALALGAVVFVAALVGATGTWLTGTSSWWLALPGLVAVGWWFLANPLDCPPPAPWREGAPRDTRNPGSAPVPSKSAQDATTP